jgi:hypothetical protein
MVAPSVRTPAPRFVFHEIQTLEMISKYSHSGGTPLQQCIPDLFVLRFLECSYIVRLILYPVPVWK